jgi:GDP-mannose 6-dehydrogenase
MDQIYGTNRSFVLSAIPHIGKLMVGRVEELLDWAEYVVITQRPAARFMERIQATGVPVLDLASDTPAPRRTVPALAVA